MNRKIIGVTVGTTMNPRRMGDYIENGKSAYEIAVKNGFNGTETEWLESLRGKDGANGTNGKDGYTPIKGVDYFDGKNGKDGIDGKDGTKGDKGDKGDQGVQGEKGEDGTAPSIGGNGNWWIGNEDTGVKAGGQGSIIDVVSLPTSDIDTNATYRVLYGTFVLDKMLRNDSTCHIVEWDSVPNEPGESVLHINDGVFSYVGYYNVTDNTVYGYFGEDTIARLIEWVNNSDLSLIVKSILIPYLQSMTAGWKTMQEIVSSVGSYLSMSWGGAITSTESANDESALYLYLYSKMFVNKNGAWVGLDDGVGLSNNVASGMASHVEGNHNQAIGNNSHAEGYDNIARGNSSHAEGEGNNATGVNAHAEGEKNNALGKNAHAEGCLTEAIGDHSHTEGYNTKANASASHAGGVGTIANVEAQTVVGKYNVADSGKAFVVGNGVSKSNRSNAMVVDWNGNATFSGDVSSKNGKLATETYVDNKVKDCATKQYVDESYTTAGKKNGTTVGEKSTVEGFDNTVTGGFSHAEGWSNTVKSNFSHAEGVNVYIEEGADVSHGEGIDIVIEGLYAHAEGYMTSVFGSMSHGEGVGNTVYGDAQHVQGSFSIDDEEGKYQHIVGNGESDESRSNAHTIDWDGNAWFSGDIKIGGAGYDDENAVRVLTDADLDRIVSAVVSALLKYNGEAVTV